MTKEIQATLAGFGGQGVLFAGKVMANAGLIEDRQLSWMPSYGPEMRGGTANCSVTLSDEPIGSPLVLHPNALIAMNQPSYDKFIDEVAPGGVVVADSDLIEGVAPREGIEVYALPATSLAEEAGLKGLSNIVLLGALWAHTQFCERETLDAAIDKSVPPSKAALIDKNKQALQIGINA
jgi:2-oxoglutarate ferredoxin oxidoreductase subunit gamma